MDFDTSIVEYNRAQAIKCQFQIGTTSEADALIIGVALIFEITVVGCSSYFNVRLRCSLCCILSGQEMDFDTSIVEYNRAQATNRQFQIGTTSEADDLLLELH